MIRSLHVKIIFLLSVLVSFAISATGQVSIDEYYQNATGKTGGELKMTLHSIIRNHTELPYTSKGTNDQYNVWEALKITDEDPDNTDNILLIYTGRSEVKTHQDNGSNDPNSWNREHIWAKSHGDFGTDRGAGTDIHHLRACDRSVNSDRSNKFFDEGGIAHSEAVDCNTDDDAFTWEPRDAVKGNIARMIFYMAVCYEGENDDPDLEMTLDMSYSSVSNKAPLFGKLSTLIEWNTQDPVDDAEQARNEKVYTIQGNRNPFIDHSEWVNTIWVDTDSNSPSITDFIPENGTVAISLTANLSLTFNEEIQEGTGTVVIKRFSDDSEFEALNVADNPRVKFINNTVLINPTAIFEEGTKYYVVIASGAITDASSNAFDGISNKTIWNFTAEFTPPAITNLSPENNSSNIPLSTLLNITFDKDITAGSGSIKLIRDSDDLLIESINVKDESVTITDNTIEINSASELDEGVKYYILIDEGAFFESGNNSNLFGGILNKTTWSFTTFYSPKIIELSPANSSNNIPINQNMEIVFNKTVETGSGSILIKKLNDNSLFESININNDQISISNNLITINPIGEFSEGTEYYILIEEGALTDSYSNNFKGITENNEWSFTTNLIPPEITNTSPLNNSENIALDVNLEITFDKEVQAGNGSIKIMNNENIVMEIAVDETAVTFSGELVSINLSQNLKPETVYYVIISNTAFSSIQGAYFAGIPSETDWSFTTEKPTGIDDLSDSRTPSFYPNPALNEIRLTNMKDVESMYISNLTGRNIMEIKSPDTRISISKLPKGMYFVTFITSGGNRVTKKLLKR